MTESPRPSPSFPNIDVITQALRELDLRLTDGARDGTIVDSCRLFHGRGRCHTGLEHVVLDWHHPCLVLTYFHEPDSAFDVFLLDAIDRCSASHVCLYVQRRYQRHPVFVCERGIAPTTIFAYRNARQYHLSFDQQNIGFFLDCEPARQWVEAQCHAVSDANILNLFSYTCVFSVVAKLAGAKSVLNMDLSSRNLACGRDNHRLNGVEQGVKYFANDILKSWGRIKRHGDYDIVICDPPSYQKGSFIAKKDYVKVLKRVRHYVKPNGKMLLCLNAPEWGEQHFRAMIETHLIGFQFEQRLDPHKDFPDIDPDRALKCLVYSKAVK